MPLLERDTLANTRQPSSAGPARIQIKAVEKQFQAKGRSVQAIDRISLDIMEGQFVSVVGPSGCGKSTLLNMVAGLRSRTGGEILIDGKPVQNGSIRRNVGYVFQRDTLYPWRTIADNVGLGLELRGVHGPELREQVSEALAQAGLADFAQHFPMTLSGGMRQRASLMRTLITHPEILLMDEPFGALDTHTKIEMQRILLQMWERDRQTVMFVTHDLSEALTLSDKVVLLKARPGRVKAIYDIDFPRPRDAVALRETPAYAKAFSSIWHSLGEEFSGQGASDHE